MKRVLLVLAVIAVIIAGCSGGGNSPSAPEQPVITAQSSTSHVPWGFWQGTIDPKAQTIEFVELRTGDFHLNVLPFLEPPVLLYLSLESAPIFNGNILDVDIGLRHPFLGLTEFTGFDVCGLFISKGSVGGFTDADLLMPGASDTRLLNPDGFSRWWNPTEFPNVGTVFGYVDGLLGSPDSTANFTATLNGYKYFCDDLSGPLAPLTEVTQANRGLFSPGKKNVRHYKIDLSGGLIFNYAVDANWSAPGGGAPWTAPDDFPAEANKQEAWRINVNEVTNTLFNDGTANGGDLSLSIDVYDWFNADMNSVRVESPGNFAMVESATAVSSGAGFSTYEIDITNATPAAGSIDLLISIASEITDFGGFITGTNTTSYFTYTSLVSNESPVTYSLVLDLPHTFDGTGNPLPWPNYRNYSPAIETGVDGSVFIMWFKIYWFLPGPPPTSINTTTYYARSYDSGSSWVEPYWAALGGFVDSDDASGAIDGVGDMYMYGCSHIVPSWTCIVRFNDWDYLNSGDWSGLFQSPSIYGRAFEFTYDGYPVTFGDYGDNIRYKKGLTPNSPLSSGGWPGWSGTPEYSAVPTPARLSKTDNIVRIPDNSLHLVYFSSDTGNDNWIRTAFNADGSALNWDYDNDVYDGTADGYDSLHDPGLNYGPDSVYRSVFVGHKTSPTETESVLYTSSTDGLSWGTPITAVQVDGVGNLLDPTVKVVTVGTTDILVLTYKNAGEIYVTYSLDDGQTWATPVIMSNGTGTAEKPDMSVTSDGYFHNTWQNDFDAADPYVGTVEYIRGGFVVN